MCRVFIRLTTDPILFQTSQCWRAHACTPASRPSWTSTGASSSSPSSLMRIRKATLTTWTRPCSSITRLDLFPKVLTLNTVDSKCSTYLHTSTYIPLPTYLPTYLYLPTYIPLPTYLPIYLYLSTYIPLHTSTYLPTYLYLSTYIPLPFYLPTSTYLKRFGNSYNEKRKVILMTSYEWIVVF